MNLNFASSAVVLSHKPYSEADKIVTLYSYDYGKISMLAHGAKRLTSRKRGSLEVFSLIKFSARRVRGLACLTEAEAVNTFPEIRNDLTKVAVSYFLLEAVSRSTRDEEENHEVYELLVQTLSEVSVATNLKQLRHQFVKKLVNLLGFAPHTDVAYDPDEMLESIIERKLGSVRVGKKLQV